MKKESINEFQQAKTNINQEPNLTFPNLQNIFDVETDASKYAMGSFFMQGNKNQYYIILKCFMGNS